MSEILASFDDAPVISTTVRRCKSKSTAHNQPKASTIVKKIIDETQESVSLYPTVKKINATHTVDEKKELLKVLWELVTVDSLIDAYEENLYFKIAELIRIPRSQANQIKHENS